MRFAAIFLTLLYVIPAVARAEPCITWDDYLHEFSTIDTPGSAYSITTAGNFLYVADSSAGLQIIDIGNLETPVIVGSLDTPGICVSVALVGSWAYLADVGIGLHVVDVSDPSTPHLVDTRPWLTEIHDICIANEFAFVADYDRGFQVYDISEPWAPTHISGIEMPGLPTAIAYSNGYSYVAAQDNGLFIVDTTDPSHPQIVASEYTGGTAFDVELDDRIAYVVGGWGLQIIAVYTPSDPRTLSKHQLFHGGNGLSVCGDYAFVAGRDGIETYNISESLSPVRVGYLVMPARPNGIVASEAWP